MDISRWGARRYRGEQHIISDLPIKVRDQQWQDDVRWDTENKQVVILARYISGGGGRVRHNYSIRLSLADVMSLIAIFGHAGVADDAMLLRDQLSKHIPALVKLLACATGLIPTPMIEMAVAPTKISSKK
jgi:hypothetical protein